MPKPRLWIFAASLAVLLGAAGAGATTFTLSATLDGAQEVPPVATPGTGSLTGTYDDVSNLLSWSGSFVGLIGTTTAAHFHGPAAVGVPAAVRLGITVPLGVSSGVFSGSATITDAFEAELLAGLWYLNIHSTFKTGGEIRGQVYAVPEPPTLLMLALGVGGLMLAGRRRGA
jgi:hypothetical protein